MAGEDDPRNSATESEQSPETQGKELGVHKLRHRVPADIRNVSFPVSVRGYDRRAVDAYVTRVNRVIAELEVSRSPQAAVRNALDRVGEQTIAILNEARESAEKIVAAAEEEAEQHIAKAKAHAADLVVNASARAEQERAEAEQIVAGARAEGDDIVAQARAAAAQTLTRSRAKAAEHLKRTEEEIAAAREHAEARLRELDADTDAVWNERDALLEEIDGIATRLQTMASGAAARASRQQAADSGEEPESGFREGAEPAEPALADALVAEIPTVDSPRKSSQSSREKRK